MPALAYLFERFPSFTQTFCYREIAELHRQGMSPAIFSIRQPGNEPAEDWDPAIVRQVGYLPPDEQLVKEVDRALRRGTLPARAADDIVAWGRKTDFLRLYQAAWLGPRLETLGVRHLHAHFAGLAARTAWWLNRFCGIGFSFTAHANDIFAPKSFEISLGALVGSARAVVTVSDFAVQFLRGKFPQAAEKIHRVYNGIALDRFERADLSETRPAIISVGRLIEKKGFCDLIEACRVLGQRGMDFRCQIIGEGPLESLLREQIARSGLTNRVALTGPLAQAEVIRRLARSTIFALACVAESGGGMDNLPTVVMEAMAAGLPIVATPIAGLPEMVEEGVSGFLIPENQPAALADALERLGSDRILRSSLGKAGRERAVELFRIEESGQKLRALFQRCGL
jgi:glycosyltransferase involved in cell wall biosynthesis